ncbi:HD-GYP domain-containing protein [Pleionea sediminis]|uniref:HD-GYP domain-containing protein n=1 Tax=Pleionea sediminis TaxID=2569479 RepID=UPI001184F58B|nr:HD-GYP domain-containing protein [Pleionea sediminis]
MLKKIDINDLVVGMYVEAIADQEGVKKVSQRGVITSEQALEALKSAGVSTVIVDTGKQINLKAEKKPSQQSTNQSSSDLEKSALNEKMPENFQLQCTRAHQIYREAKKVLKKSIQNWSKGEVLDVEKFKVLSENLIDGLLEDTDSMHLVTMIRHKDEYLLEHSINVALLMAAFALHMELSREVARELTLGAFLHDIGKVKVDEKILNKPGPLTKEEFEHIKEHVKYGLEAVANDPNVSDTARCVIGEHHEFLDGSGYPGKLIGEQISLYGRMATIVDTYDAITSDRCYQDGQISSKAFRIMLQNTESQYDTELVGKFVKCMGVYPVGSLVELSRGKIGVVIRSNSANPLRPLVKVFYNLKQQHYVEPVDVDLSRAFEKDEIKRSHRGEDLKLDIPRFFEEFII